MSMLSSLAVQRPIYQPAMRIISNITNDFPATVTTTFNHQYIDGVIIRLNIPQGYGMQEVNQMFGPIMVVDNVTFTIAIDTTLFSPFSVPGTFPDNYQYPQCVPFGEINETLKSATVNVLPFTG